MADKFILNPNQLGKTVSDFRTYVDDDGNLISALEQVIVDTICAGNVLRGQLVRITNPATATAKAQTTVCAAALAGYLVYGVAMTNSPAAAGSSLQVCVRGLCRVFVGAGVAAVDNWGSMSPATAGLCLPNVGTPANTVTLGEHLGVFLGAKDTNNLAPFFFKQF